MRPQKKGLVPTQIYAVADKSMVSFEMAKKNICFQQPPPWVMGIQGSAMIRYLGAESHKLDV